ncbi:3-deoxy-8-phosphooctulonate synthase [Brachyspira alvinipulli]|uniref:3-deoxy-8-phosphooctulonate synthase n=1 Tax=Brachyspira alvinipulli TaxID=84379 RepID=UPI000485679C|nr:3-deoxy-8-phosphooctulonate synthase [Brachyspira alvinipulli]
MIFDYKGITNKNRDLIFIAGPCVIESEEMTMYIAKKLKEIKDKLNIQLVLKGSFDKANRTSLSSFRGLGMKEGLKILQNAGKEFSLPTLTDIHIPSDAYEAAEYVDFLQIPAFLCRQTDMLRAACETGKAVNVKKGQFISGYDCKYIADKCSDAINEKRLFLCERGTMFGYGNLIVDMKNLEIMKNYAPVMYDATHSVQMPSANNGISGGAREFIPSLLKAAVALGVDAVFMEVHPNPDKSPSDAGTIFELDKVEELWAQIIKINDLVKNMQ